MLAMTAFGHALIASLAIWFLIGLAVVLLT
jgi:hypothetical protein